MGGRACGPRGERLLANPPAASAPCLFPPLLPVVCSAHIPPLWFKLSYLWRERLELLSMALLTATSSVVALALVKPAGLN